MPPVIVRERFLASLRQRLSALKTALPTVPVVRPPSSFQLAPANPRRLTDGAGQCVPPDVSGGPRLPRMSDGLRMYSQRFRAANALAPDAAPVAVPPADVKTARTHAPHADGILVNAPRPSLEAPRTRAAELQKWDAVLKSVYEAWPKDDGKLITGAHAANLTQRLIQFSDGSMDLRTIVRRHWLAVTQYNKREAPEARIKHPASHYTHDYFLWALQRASGVSEVRLDRNYNRPNTVVEISLNKPDLEKPGVAEAVLREVWPKLSDGLKVTDVLFQDRSGRRVRMMRALEVYWKGLKAQLIQEGKWTAQIPQDPYRDQPLQLMHLHLFGRAILGDGLVAHYPNLPMPVPDYTTLEGITRIADAVSQLPFVRAARMFPGKHGRRRDVVVLADGTVLRYETVIERLTQLVAMAKAEGHLRVAQVKMDEAYVQMAREDLAALKAVQRAGGLRRNIVLRSRTVPNEATRKALYEWLLLGQKSTLVRRRPSGDVIPVFPQPAIPPPPPRPAPMIPPPRPAPVVVPPSSPLEDGDRLAAEANDLAARLSVLRRYSTTTRKRWDDLAWALEKEDGGLAGKLPRIRAFVEAEEQRIGETRLRQSPPDWAPDPVVVPPYLHDRLMAAYGNPEQHVTIGDLSRAYHYYFGEMGDLPPGRAHRGQLRSTQEIVYGDTVHRQLTHLASLNDAEDQARSQVAALARVAKMHDFGGHWWAMGVKMANPDRVTIPSTVRFYLPIRPEHAADVMAALIALVGPEVRAVNDVQFKMAQDPRAWRGDDGALVYSGRQDGLRMMQALRALEDQNPDWFRPPAGTPLVARLIKPDGTPSAISMAQSSPKASESVNGPIAEYATRAMQWYRLQRARGLPTDVEAMIRFVARQLQKSGRDLDHPAFLMQDPDTGLSGWQTYLGLYVQSDQFFPQDVPLALELARHTPDILAVIHHRYPATRGRP